MLRVLVISYYVNSDGVACSHHIDDRIMELVDLGHSVTVASASFVPPLNGIAHLRYSSMSPGGLRFELRQRLKRSSGSLWMRLFWRITIIFNQIPYAIDRMTFRSDVTWSWSKSATRGIVKECKDKGFDLIYSTGGPPAAHLVALNVLKEIKIPWMAEFQDPLIHDYCAKSSAELAKLMRLEKDVLSNSLKTVFLTNAAAKKAVERTQIKGSTVTVYSGAPACPSSAPLSTEIRPILDLAHFGSLGGIRNLATFIEGMKIAVKVRPKIKSDVKVNLYGTLGQDDRTRIMEFDLGDIFSEKGVCTRTDALLSMRNSTVLLLVQGEHPISIETIPSKTYEYLNTGKTIFALVHKNQELTSMICTSGGMVAEVSRPTEISSRLLELHDLWCHDPTFASGPVNRFLVKDSVAKMLELSLKN